MMQKTKLKMYEGMISENQRARTILVNREIVLIRYYFSNILFMYYYGPFQNASPIIEDIIARVNMHTNLPGDVTMLKMFTRERNRSNRLIPKEASEYPIIGVSGRYENNLSMQVVGGYTVCFCAGYFVK